VVRRARGRDRPYAACCGVPSRQLPTHEHLLARACRTGVAAVIRPRSFCVICAVPCAPRRRSARRDGREPGVEVGGALEAGSPTRTAGMGMHPVRTRMIAMTIVAQSWAKLPGERRRCGESAGTKWLLAGGPYFASFDANPSSVAGPSPVRDAGFADRPRSRGAFFERDNGWCARRPMP